MDIIGTNQEEKDRKSKKLMIWITITIILLFIISIVLIITIGQLKKQLFKLEIDGVRKNTTASDLFNYEGNKIYVSLQDVASLINYKYYNGEYKGYTEEADSCYLECENEVVTFEKNSNKI